MNQSAPEPSQRYCRVCGMGYANLRTARHGQIVWFHQDCFDRQRLEIVNAGKRIAAGVLPENRKERMTKKRTKKRRAEEAAATKLLKQEAARIREELTEEAQAQAVAGVLASSDTMAEVERSTLNKLRDAEEIDTENLDANLAAERVALFKTLAGFLREGNLPLDRLAKPPLNLSEADIAEVIRLSKEDKAAP